MKYFSIRELCQSDTAEKHGIDNTIPKSLEPNLVDLINYVLDPIREAYKKPITLNCGYRCPKVNNMVGSDNKSDHPKGRAADIRNTEELQKLIIEMIKADKIDFDQFIIEKPNVKGVGEWLHISYRKGKNRKQLLIFKNGAYVPFTL